MKLSIIIPAYNCADKIIKTIDSILCQKLTDYEIIVVDDNSTDNLEEVIKKIDINNIIYLKQPVNKGVSHSRNIGIDSAKGKYIIFLDADDEQIDNMSIKLLNKIEEGYKLVYCLFFVYENGKVFKHPKRKCEINSVQDFIKYMEINNMLKSSCNKIYLKEILDDNNIRFNEKSSLGEDYIFNLNYVSSLKNIDDIFFIDEYLYKYNRSSNGLSKKKRSNRALIKLQNINYHFKLIDNKDCSYLYYNYLKIILLNILEKNSVLKKEEVIIRLKEILKESKSIKERFLARIILNNFLLLRIVIIILKLLGK